ncbi:hypothetical protein GCM10009818_02320 [Nakamurella flavida]
MGAAIDMDPDSEPDASELISIELLGSELGVVIPAAELLAGLEAADVWAAVVLGAAVSEPPQPARNRAPAALRPTSIVVVRFMGSLSTGSAVRFRTAACNRWCWTGPRDTGPNCGS